MYVHMMWVFLERHSKIIYVPRQSAGPFTLPLKARIVPVLGMYLSVVLLAFHSVCEWLLYCIAD
jgi:hypothetical protein